MEWYREQKTEDLELTLEGLQKEISFGGQTVAELNPLASAGLI